MNISKTAQWVIGMIVFVLFTVNATATVIYARSAEANARDVKRELDALTITTQNKCIVRMVLSYPPPVPQEEFDIILAEYEKCITAQAKEIKEQEGN